MSAGKKIALYLILWVGFTAVTPTQAQDPPVVRAVMFWMEGCGHCDRIKKDVLPPLAAQYGEQWQLEQIELRSAEDFDRLYEMGAALGIPRAQVGVPFLLIGDQVLIGAGQIPAELPGLIEDYLAAGGVGWPAAPGLDWFLPQLAGNAATPVPLDLIAPALAVEAAPAPEPLRNGFLLAWLVMVGMVLALGYTAVRLRRACRGSIRKQPPAWLTFTLPPLTAVGLGVAIYLSYVETQPVTAICGPVGDCNAVQNSPYATIFGVPVGVLGVVGYLVILAAWGLHQWRRDERAALALVVLSGFGVLFSIYLTYLELFVIEAVCAWCLSSAVIMALLLMVSGETAVADLQPARSRTAHRR